VIEGSRQIPRGVKIISILVIISSLISMVSGFLSLVGISFLPIFILASYMLGMGIIIVVISLLVSFTGIML